MGVTIQTGEDFQRRPSTKATSPFRYPGGKGFLTDYLKVKIEALPGPARRYAEPFCGGAGAATNLLVDGVVSQIHLNDLDSRVYSAWLAIITETDRFIEKLKHAPVTVDEWKKQRKVVAGSSGGYDFDVGYATFYLNRTSRAGIVIGSGPIGGYKQEGAWKIGARFYRDTMIDRIEKLGNLKEQISVSNMAATDFLSEIDKSDSAHNTLVFIDPPYYEAGARLYLDGMEGDGHAVLANKLRQKMKYKWLMTYDSHPEILNLYKGFDVKHLEVLYSLQRQRKVKEVVIQAASS